MPTIHPSIALKMASVIVSGLFANAYNIVVKAWHDYYQHNYQDQVWMYL